METRLSRRGFLRRAATASAGMAIPLIVSGRALGADGKVPASERVTLGFIGAGGMNNAHLGGILGNPRCTVLAVCDVDQSRRMATQQRVGSQCAAYNDYRQLLDRKDIDAVFVATPDHWHTLISIDACKAGKDIYCEKPLTLTIAEGQRLVEVERQTGRILQTGTQQRSSVHFRLACDLVRNGRIGKLQRAEVWLPAGLRQGPFQTSAVPEGFDYDFWMGQTPKVPYVKERTHFSFRYWWDYSGGTMTDWGAHHNDIVLWTLGMDQSGPISIEGKQLVEMIPGGFTAASEYEVTYTYANGVVHTSRSTTASEWHGGVKDPKGQQHGIKFIGSDGWIWVTRGILQASDRELLTDKLPESAPRVYVSNDHIVNFIDCVKTRKPPICPAQVGHRSASLCHLGVISIRLGRKLNWDPAREQFVGDAEAATYLAREMRKPYDYDMV